MYQVSLESVIYIALAPFMLVPAMVAIFSVLEIAGRVWGWWVVRRFRLAAENINTSEAFAEVLEMLAMSRAVHEVPVCCSTPPTVDNCARILPALDFPEADLPGQRRPCGVHPVVTPDMLRPIDPASKAKAVEDFDDTGKHQAIQYPTPFQLMQSSPFYFDSSMLKAGQTVTGCITIR
jgi:hypothetical protein